MGITVLNVTRYNRIRRDRTELKLCQFSWLTKSEQRRIRKMDPNALVSERTAEIMVGVPDLILYKREHSEDSISDFDKGWTNVVVAKSPKRSS